MNKIKILQVGKYYPPQWGGIETVCYELSEGLDKLNFTPDVICFSGSKSKSIEEKNGYKVYRTKCAIKLKSQPMSLDYLLTFRKIRNNYDIFLLHMPNLFALLAILLFKPKGKIILHWHSDVIKQKSLIRLVDMLIFLINNHITNVLVPTENHVLYSRYRNKFEYKKEVIPYCISKKQLEISDDVRKKTEYIKDKFYEKKIIFSVGRLVSYKGFSYLIEAASLLPDEYIVMIGGTGPLKDNLLNKIKSLGLQHKVLLLGRLSEDDLKAYYNACNVFCLPSITKAEMFGMVQLEAMYYGKPVVSTEIKGSGVSIVNKHNESGIVVPVKNSSAIAEAIININQSELVYESLCNGARNRFLSNFENEEVINRYQQLFSKIIKTNE